MHLGEKIKFALAKMGITNAEFSRRVLAERGNSELTLSKQAVSGWIKTGRIDKGWVTSIANVLDVNIDWLLSTDSDGESIEWQEPYYRIEVAPDEDPSLRIPYMNASGSCGDGFDNSDPHQKGYLNKEPSWFAKYGVTNDQVAAIYADGDSMADFIVHGDMVIFNITKTTPIDGKIFALEHPRGTIIKKLRQNFDRSWTLISNNPDKRLYSDENISAEDAENMVIRGEFVYRQGG